MTRVRLFSIIAASGAGGAEQVFATLLQGLDSARYEVVVACHGRGSMAATFARHAAQVTSLDLVRLRPGTVRDLATLMRDARCDVVHTHLWTADVLGGMAARVAGVSAWVSSVAGAYFLPIDVTGVRRARRVAMSRLYRSIYWGCDRVIAPSRYVADDLRTRSGIAVPEARLEVIENGVDVDDAERAARRGETGTAVRWGNGAPTVAVVANFFPIKGHRYLIEAVPAVLRAFPDAHFVLAGDGPTRTEMMRLATELGVDAQMSFPGEIPDALDLMRASDLVVLPSLSEGLPITLVEAMALGRPVVATRVGGIPEVAEDGVTARLVPPREASTLASAIIGVLRDAELAERLGSAARERARERFSADRMVRRTEAVYQELAGP